MEIERKYQIRRLPDHLDRYESHHICQAYLCTDPVIRVRRKDDDYILTVKGKGMLAREEVEMSLTEEAFRSLYGKKEGIAIEKTRYVIPDGKGFLIELDVFEGVYEGFIMAEVEFPDLEQAENYIPPSWFGREVTMDSRFHNASLSRRSEEEAREFLNEIITQI